MKNYQIERKTRFFKTCGVDAPNAGQCGDVAGVRHEFIEGNNAGDDDSSVTARENTGTPPPGTYRN